MLRNTSLTVLASMLLCSTLALAKAPTVAPAGTTGMCKDGTWTSAASKSGACSGHDGVKKWYGVAAAAGAASPTSNSSDAAASSKSKSKAKSEAPAETTAAAPASSGSDTGASSSKSKKKSEAAAPAAAAGPATGVCKDGTSTSATSKSGACSGHGGVKEWYGAAGAAAAVPATPAAAAAPAAAPAKATAPAPAATPAPGGGAGKVWANKLSKVYHCPNDQWYGKTKEGAYMSEADAVAQGYRADHGKACQ